MQHSVGWPSVLSRTSPAPQMLENGSCWSTILAVPRLHWCYSLSATLVVKSWSQQKVLVDARNIETDKNSTQANHTYCAVPLCWTLHSMTSTRRPSSITISNYWLNLEEDGSSIPRTTWRINCLHWLIWDMSSQRICILTQPCRYSQWAVCLSLLLPMQGRCALSGLRMLGFTRPFRITHWLLFLRSHTFTVLTNTLLK